MVPSVQHCGNEGIIKCDGLGVKVFMAENDEFISTAIPVALMLDSAHD
ncbi:hypothetical protein [Streptomyces sp. NBC_00038]|nr:hypothetical protein [Streptomyces sp. NBC_00038]MCX5556506.1 hypothetical protein [Streptomyces sp. NBC_00038]